MSYASLSVWKLHPHSKVISKIYKPTFHSGHLSCNMSYGSAATLWVFCLLLWQPLIVMNLFLRIGNKNNSCIRETQENSIEISLQTSLPYIVLQMVCAKYCALYPKQPCVVHEANMWYSCCIMSFVLESFTKFSQVL